MNKFFVVMTALVAVSMLNPVSAQDCVPAEQTPEVDTGDTPAGRFYVDNDLCQADGCGFSIWIYQESNGVDGLQRNDEISGDQACGNGDTIIF